MGCGRREPVAPVDDIDGGGCGGWLEGRKEWAVGFILACAVSKEMKWIEGRQ